MEPAAITDEVKKANLRGLGGAGFPTGMKWSFVPKNHTGPVYLVINADEGEPGTFKDRYLLERDPHALIEGMLIAARAIRCEKAFVYIRGEYVEPHRRFAAAAPDTAASKASCRADPRPRSCAPTRSTSRWTSTGSGTRERWPARRASSCSTRPYRSPRRSWWWPASTLTSRAASARRAASPRAGSTR